MSKRDQKLKEKKRQPKSPGPITRRQQTEALRQVKGYEIASAVSNTIRSAVQQEVETQLKVVWDAMIDLVSRAPENTHESDSNNRPERTEAPAVQQDDQVVPGTVLEGTDCSSPDAT